MSPDAKWRRPGGYGRDPETVEDEVPDVVHEGCEVRLLRRPRVGLVEQHHEPSLASESSSNTLELGVPGSRWVSNKVESCLVEVQTLGEVDQRRVRSVVGPRRRRHEDRPDRPVAGEAVVEPFEDRTLAGSGVT